MPDLSITGAGRLDGATVDARLHQAARQFEQQFAAQLLKPMSDHSMGEDAMLGSDPGNEVFQGMLTDGLAEHAAGGLGISAIIEHAMRQRLGR